MNFCSLLFALILRYMLMYILCHLDINKKLCPDFLWKIW